MRKQLFALRLVPGLALAVVTSVVLVSSPRTVLAAGSGTMPPPEAFALAPMIFPSGARVAGAPATPTSQQSASQLHTESFITLGYVEGYRQTANWSIFPSDSVRLTYLASVFRSAAEAQSASSDSQTSLWEIGWPLPRLVGS